jgi:hypothetical protein
MNSWFKKLVPHLIAVAVFLVVALIYCRPVLEGKVVSQHDITHWKGAIQQSEVYKQTHGSAPLWTNSLFSGMPAFQIGYAANNVVPWYAHQFFTLGLPKPIQFFFLACICFYFLTVVLGIRPVIGIMGSLAFGYATYNPVIIAVGHDTKMLTMAYMPALLGSLLLIYEKKYWLGAALTALFTSVMICMNHPQIAYYFFIAVAIMSIFYAVRWIRNKEWAHLIKVFGFTVAAGLIGVLTNAVSILSTYEYQKETIRGGASLITEENKKDKSKTGLDKSYAFSYSMGIAEPFVMMVPRMYGGSNDHLEIQEEKSKAIEKLRNMPQEAQQFLFQSFPFFGQTESGELYARTYWGGIGGTSGPPYVGAIICFLAILAFFVPDNNHKWWILATVILTIMMSWGGYFESFNGLLYEYLPLYNKFRAPSMILVIPQLLLPLLAAMGVNAMINTSAKKELFKKLKKGALVTAGIFIILLAMYFSFDFINEDTKKMLRDPQLNQQPQAVEVVRQFISGLKEDRRALMINDILRSFGFIAAAALLIFLFIRNTIKPAFLAIALAALVLLDVIPIDSIYLNKNNYKDAEENTEAFLQTPADNEMLADKSFFRVYNVAGDRFSENITSYYYNSIGGYHPAKISTYQDLIEQQLSKGNEKVLDMLNAKYLIQKNEKGQTEKYQKRTTALGNCWFVKHILYVRDANEEIKALDNFNPADTAVVQESFKTTIPFSPQYDSAATIQLVKNDYDVVTYTSNSATNQFAVFSEVYYASGWKAYVDGKETPVVKVNYTLRGLALPAGKHEIKFEFKPQGYYKGRKLTSIFSIVLLALLATGIFMEWRNRNQSALANRA